MTYVPVPACEWIAPRLASLTWSVASLKCFLIDDCNCQTANTPCISPVAPTGWPQAINPPDGLTAQTGFSASLSP